MNNRDSLLRLLDNVWDRYHQASDTDKAVIEREICRIRIAILMDDLKRNV